MWYTKGITQLTLREMVKLGFLLIFHLVMDQSIAAQKMLYFIGFNIHELMHMHVLLWRFLIQKKKSFIVVYVFITWVSTRAYKYPTPTNSYHQHTLGISNSHCNLQTHFYSSIVQKGKWAAAAGGWWTRWIWWWLASRLWRWLFLHYWIWKVQLQKIMLLLRLGCSPEHLFLFRMGCLKDVSDRRWTW